VKKWEKIHYLIVGTTKQILMKTQIIKRTRRIKRMAKQVLMKTQIIKRTRRIKRIQKTQRTQRIKRTQRMQRTQEPMKLSYQKVL